MQHLQDTDFVPWLQNQDRTIFWITGVPASGKSTLMKFISNNASLEENLRIWACSCRLHIATFYFWGPGSAIQRSRNGLLRSLLHQLLSQRPESISVVAPRRRLFSSLANTSAVHPVWEWIELCECFSRFASYAQQTRSRVALFLDGLDEYEGNTEELVSFLLDLHRDFDLKLFVSSRPWNVFADAFCQSPLLTMEKINGPDIDIYVEQKLCKSPAIEDLRVVIPEEIDKLTNEIKIKAKGVFLWVVLVVEQLLQTSRENPRLSSIREIFDSLPEELENLYNRILGQIGPEKQLVASRLYHLVMEWKRTWNGQMPTTYLWLAINIADPLERLIYPAPVNIEGIVKLLGRLLRGHTRGILQISKSFMTDPGEGYTVDFLHRTAFEWLRMESNWSQICEQGGAEYQAMIYILHVLVSQICSTSMYPTPEHKQRLGRIFMLSREIPNTSNRRIQLVKIIDDIDEKCFDGLAASGTKFRQPSSRSWGRSGPSLETSKFNTMTCAAAWSSDAYLHGKLDSFGISGKRSSFLRRRESGLQPVLEVAVCSFISPEFPLSDWDSKHRSFSFWHTSKRLHTIHVLLQRGAKISRSQCQKLKMALNDASRAERLYLQILEEARSSRNMAASLEKQLAKYFPVTLVASDRLRHEFPNYFILNDK